ncbi:hypothetical protein [Salininema proteolyticum]|uniref:Glycine zipper-like domain-containing protein n=1 Tax=Salininema proteolyticum TaxID=1607685 RepID=A0ABV8TSW9_9ACTN
MTDQKRSPKYPLYMVIGMSVGTAIGVVNDDIGVWMPIGMAVGLSIGVAMDGRAEKDAEKAERDEGPPSA